MKKLVSLIVILALTCVVSAQNSPNHKNSVKTETEEPDTEAPFRYAETMPEFPGGMEAMYAYLQKEIKYPKSAINKKIEGTVLIEFVIEKDGKVTNVKPLVPLSSECDSEAIRVVKKMPKWKPGTNDGKPVRCYFNLPIRFKL